MDFDFIFHAAFCAVIILMTWFARPLWDAWRNIDRFAYYKQQLLELGSERIIVRVDGLPLLDMSIYQWRNFRALNAGRDPLSDFYPGKDSKPVSVTLESGPYIRAQIHELRGYGDQ